ncbi:MAG: DUF359 domain-containing protein [Candidatus Bathyarchaeia archaeon]
MHSRSDSRRFSSRDNPKKTLVLPEEMRGELKRPLGLLIEGNPDETVRRLGEIYSVMKPPMFASVGDFVSKNLLTHCLEPDIIVFDGRIMRRDVEPIEPEGRCEIVTRNRPGMIEKSAWEALGKAVKLKRKVAVLVEGEEDLMVIPLILLMPLGSVIVYGQPNVGVVMIEVDEKMKDWAEGFIARMGKSGDEDEDDLN